MRNIVNSIVAFLITYSYPVLAAVGEGGALAPEPTVSVGWVWFFLVVFVAICAWFGIAIWKAEKKSRAAAVPEGTQR